MAKKNISKASKRRLFTFGSLSIFIIIYFFVTSFQYILNINKLERNEKNLSDELLALKNEEGNLKNEIQKLNDPDYIARYARENYLYSKDGEYVIRIEPKEETAAIEKKKSNSKKIITAGISGMAIIFILIKIKK